jgi:predicted nucleic acid-binding protein
MKQWSGKMGNKWQEYAQTGIPKYFNLPKVNKKTPITAMGSCFAVELKNELNKRGFKVSPTEMNQKLFLSVMTECEIFSGLDADADLNQFRFLNTQKYISIDSEIARLAGVIRGSQKQKGRKLKAPDALIIATAKLHNLTLV